MISSKLVNQLEENLDSIVQVWFEEAKSSVNMKTYKTFDDNEVLGRGKAVFSHLIEWLKEGADSDDVEKYFEEVGKIRLKEGFPLTEVHYALYLTKKIFWGNIDWRDAISGSFQTSSTTQIMSVINNYFDLGNFFITRGYLHELFNRLGENSQLSTSELKKLLLEGVSDISLDDDEDIIWRHV